ncbi:DUF2141 domain-containing protein [Ottowia sp.]|uniref:DUF2141 domain-containing protein n=1 Tax=Ottowia sp. TaxID=1898956 RepID=UPI003A84D3D6
MPATTPLRHLATSLFLIPLACSPVWAADVTVELLGIQSAQGNVRAALYGSADTWMKEPQMLSGQSAPAAAPKSVLVFKNVTPGRYALSVFHDQNANDKLDTNVVGLPTEAYGTSRDARGRMGPPAWDDAVVDVQGDTTLVIHLE